MPTLKSGTAEIVSDAIVSTVLSWGITENIKCLSFDTTSVNTGRKNGVCVLLEKKLEKDMLWLPCCHHILEIMLEGVVSQSLSKSSGPEIQIFKKFQKSWKDINKSQFETAVTNRSITGNFLQVFSKC